jgi:hypothetical protein
MDESLRGPGRCDRCCHLYATQANVIVNQNMLIISATADDKEDKGEHLYRGIAGRSSERRLNLADYIIVKGASLDDGLLPDRVLPEAMSRVTLKSRLERLQAKATKSALSNILRSAPIYAGMRVDEIAAINISDVMNHHGEIRTEIKLAANQTKGKN